MHNFKKVVLENVSYVNVEDLLAKEEQYQRSFQAVKSKWFYNKSYAKGPFYCTGEHTKNSLWVNDGVCNKRVSSKDATLLQTRGFTLGRLGATHNRCRVYINNGNTTKSIPHSQVQQFLSIGWVIGRLRGNQNGKNWIHNKSTNKRKLVPVLKIQQYVNDGWSTGIK